MHSPQKKNKKQSIIKINIIPALVTKAVFIIWSLDTESTGMICGVNGETTVS